jgi:hypothetical protein
MSQVIEILKWIGTFCVIAAASCRAFEFHAADLLFSITGAGLWGFTAIALKDKALFVVNAFVVIVLIMGVIV